MTSEFSGLQLLVQIPLKHPTRARLPFRGGVRKGWTIVRENEETQPKRARTHDSIGKIVTPQVIFHTGIPVECDADVGVGRSLLLLPVTIREIVTFLADNNVLHAAARADFVAHISVPGARFDENNLLLNPDEIWPANADTAAVVASDFDAYQNWLNRVRNRTSSIYLTLRFNTSSFENGKMKCNFFLSFVGTDALKDLKSEFHPVEVDKKSYAELKKSYANIERSGNCGSSTLNRGSALGSQATEQLAAQGNCENWAAENQNTKSIQSKTCKKKLALSTWRLIRVSNQNPVVDGGWEAHQVSHHLISSLFPECVNEREKVGDKIPTKSDDEIE
ncbi:hypothetical protein DMENIID0001_060490 [Sergentomyia squamirostris]